MKSSPAATLNVFSAIPASPVFADNSSEERVAVLILNAGGKGHGALALGCPVTGKGACLTAGEYMRFQQRSDTRPAHGPPALVISNWCVRPSS